MSETGPVTIARFALEHEAQIAAAKLEAAGVRTFLADAELGTMYGSYMGTASGGVQVQVAASDVDRSREILVSGDQVEVADWECPQCGTDVEGQFDICWNCSTARDDSLDAAELPLEAVEVSEIPSNRAEIDQQRDRYASSRDEFGSDNPVLDDEFGVTDEEILAANDVLASKAFRGAALSVIFPPLILLAIPLVLRVSMLNLSSHGERRFYAAFVISVVSALTWLAILRLILQSAG